MSTTTSIENAVVALHRGGVIAYPTEAVWGLGCDPRDQAATMRLLALKQREVEKGLILIAADESQLAPFIDMAALDTTPPAPEAPPEGAVLELYERGHRLALALPVFAWPCTIGRAATADLVLTDASIAPEHVRLHRSGADTYDIEVLDSVNGVWLGKRHYSVGERFRWTPGLRLTLGNGATVRWK